MQIKTKIVSCHTADSKPVKQEVNSLVIFPPWYFLARNICMKPNFETLKYLQQTIFRICLFSKKHPKIALWCIGVYYTLFY